MNGSYIGVVTCRGLEALFPESEKVIRLLDRRIYGKRPYLGYCCWAVLAEDVAQHVQRYLELGDFQSAFHTLQVLATDYGPVMPSDRPRPNPKPRH